jgi:DNA-binding transcriptional LysR family regulator
MENFRLKVFRAVATQLNFRRAAEGLFLTQPAVTQQIKALEAELGVALFDRSGGRVALTQPGRILLEYANRLKGTADEAMQALAEAMGEAGGPLSVGASQTIGQYVLPMLLSGFLRENPRVQVKAVSGNTDEILEALTSHAVDIAMIEGPAMRRDVVTEPFMHDRMVLVVPAGHEFAGHPLPLAMLAQTPLLVREQGSGSRRVMEQALEKAGLRCKDLHIAMTLDTTEGLLSAVEAGLGVTFASEWSLRNQIALGTLKVVEVEGLEVTRTFSVVYPAGPAPVGTAGAFHRFVLTAAGAEPPTAKGPKAA